MKAKFVNEIKRDSAKSKLGSIGVGKIAIYPAFYYFLERMPKHMSYENDTIVDFIQHHSFMIDSDKLENFLEPPYDNYLVIKNISNNFMGDYLENLEGKTRAELISKNDDEYYINAFYNKTYNVGFFNTVLRDKSNYVFFVKYQ